MNTPEPKAWYTERRISDTGAQVFYISPTSIEGETPLYALKDGEVEIVRHGKWVDSRCSICKEMAFGTNDPYMDDSYNYLESDFCPHCGAKMDGES